jgi:hypothetical protein
LLFLNLVFLLCFFFSFVSFSITIFLSLFLPPSLSLLLLCYNPLLSLLTTLSAPSHPLSSPSSPPSPILPQAVTTPPIPTTNSPPAD